MVTAHQSAGWYEDPTSPGSARYWDGSRWTEHVAVHNAASHRRASDVAEIVRLFLSDAVDQGVRTERWGEIEPLVRPWADARSASSEWILRRPNPVPPALAVRQPLTATRIVTGAPPAPALVGAGRVPVGEALLAPPGPATDGVATRPVPPLRPPSPLAEPTSVARIPPLPSSTPARPTTVARIPPPPPLPSSLLRPTEARPTEARPTEARPTEARPTEAPALQRRTPRARVAPARPSWIARLWSAVVSDMGIHGLAYLGVLLIFAGVTGFVVFAFGNVERTLRPVAELAIPASLLVAGWYLRRRRAALVGTALVVAGAAVAPIVAVAAFVDDSPVPPDPTGWALVVTATLAAVAVAAVYAAWTWRYPSSPVRFLVAPVAWMAVGLAALWPRADGLAGREIAGLGPGQLAAMSAAVAATAGWARWRPRARLAAASLVSAALGIVVVALFAVVSATQESWPPAAAAVFGVALAAAAEAVAPRVPARLIGAAQAVAVGVAVLGFARDVDGPWVGVIGVGAFLALLEVQSARRPNAVSLGTAGAGALAALVASAFAPWPAVAGFATASAWAHVRRAVRPAWLPATVAAWAAALLPAGAVVASTQATHPPTAAIAVSIAAVALTTLVPRRAFDPFLTRWSMGFALVAAALPIAVVDGAETDADWTRLAVAAALAAAALAASPAPVAPRVWAVAATAVEAGVFAATSLGVDARWQVVGLAGVGLLAVLAVAARPTPAWGPTAGAAGHAGLAGHVASLVALGLVPFAHERIGTTDPDVKGWPVSLVLAGAVAGWTATTWRDRHRGTVALDPVLRVVPGESDRRIVGSVPALLALLGGAALVVSVLDSADWWHVSAGVAAIALAATALAEGASTWLAPRPAQDRRLLTVAFGRVTAAAAATVAVAAMVTSTAGRRWPALLTAGLVSVSAVVVRPRWRVGVEHVVALGSLAAVVGLGADRPAAALSVGGVAVVTVGLRPFAARDDLLRWWLAAVALAAAVLPVLVAGFADGRPAFVRLGVAAGLATFAVVAAPLPDTARTWATAGALTATAAFAMGSAGVPGRWQVLVLGAAGAALVAATAVRPADRWGEGRLGRLMANVHLIGLFAGVLALVFVAGVPVEPGDRRWSDHWNAWHGWVVSGVVGAFAAAWLVTTWRQERGGSAAGRAVARTFEPAPAGVVPWDLPAAVTLVAVAGLTLSVLDSGGWLDPSGGRAALALGSVAALAGLATRALARRVHVARPLADLGLLGGLGAVAVAVGEPWPLAVTAALVTLGAVATVPERRRPWTPWIAWAATGVTAVQGAVIAGVSEDRSFLPAFVWGGALVVGALGAERWHLGPRRGAGWARTAWAWPPATLGAATAAVSVGPIRGLADSARGGWTLGAAAVVFAVAALTGAGVVSAAGWVLAVAGTAALVPFDPADHPWTLVVAAAVLVVVSAPTERLVPRRRFVERWDLAPLGVGVATAVVGVLAAPAVDSVVPTWAGAGTLALALAAWRREWPWVVPGLALLHVAAGVADPGWLTLTLTATSAGATVAAARLRRPVRIVLQVVGVIAAGGAWSSLCAYMGWDRSAVAMLTAVVAGAVLLWHALALRILRLEPEWAYAWGSLGIAGLLAEIGLLPGTDRLSAGLGLAAGLALAGVGSAVAAGPLRLDVLRPASAVLAAASGLALWYATDAGPGWVVAAGLTVGTVGCAAALLLFRAHGGSPWRWPLAIVGLGAVLVAAGAAAVPLPEDRGLMVAVLAVAGGLAGAAGLLAPSAVLQAASPVLLCASWLTYASEAVHGEPLWFTAPIGFSLLVEVGIVRYETAATGGRGTPALGVLVEAAGMGFLAAPPVVEAVTDHLLYAGLALVVGIGLAAWGAISEVRRRLGVGAGTVIAAIVVLLGVPMSRISLGEDVTKSAAFWLLIIAAGLLALGMAVFLERGKAKVRQAVKRFSEITEGWE